MRRNTNTTTKRKTNRYKNNKKHLEYGTVIDRISNIGGNLGVGFAAGLASTIAMNHFLSNNSSNSSNSQEHIINKLEEIEEKVNKIDKQTDETEGMLNKLQAGQTVIFNTLQEVGKTTAKLVIQQINETGVNLTKEQTQIITDRVTKAVHENGQPLTKEQMKEVINESLKEGKIATTEDVETAVDNAVTTVTKDMNENFEDIKAGQTVIFNVTQTIQKHGINLSNETIASITEATINQLKNTKDISMLTEKQIEDLANKICTNIKANNKNINDNDLAGLKKDIKQIITTTKDTNDKVTKLLDKENNTAPIANQASKLYRDINTDNDYSENSHLSNKEMLDYYGHKNGSKLTDYAILQKYKDFGQIDLKNEKQKLQEWDAIMREAQNKADMISNYVEDNGTRFGGHLFNTVGGEKFLTDNDLLEQGLTGKDITTIKKYDLLDNGGNNDGKISKEEAINAGVVGEASFQQHKLDNATQRLFNNLGGEDNIATEEELRILKEFGYDPTDIYNKYKITIGNKTGIAKGDFSRATDEIDLKKINDYIDTLPADIRKDFIKTVDTDGDDKISSKEELATAIENFNLFKDKLQNDVLFHHDFITENSSTGQHTNLIRVYYKELKNGLHYKYSKDDRKFVTTDDKFDKSSITCDNKEIEDILVNGRKFIDIGKFKIDDGEVIDGITLLDDNMKDAIAKTSGKKDFQHCTEEDIKNFEKKWQCKDQYDVYNLGALKNNTINTHALFRDEEIIKTTTLNEKTIAGYDNTGKTAKLLDYVDGKQDGFIDKQTFVNDTIINGHKIRLDKNASGDVSRDELDAYINEVENILGEEKVNEICGKNNDTMNVKAVNNDNVDNGQKSFNLNSTTESETQQKAINNDGINYESNGLNLNNNTENTQNNAITTS